MKREYNIWMASITRKTVALIGMAFIEIAYLFRFYMHNRKSQGLVYRFGLSNLIVKGTYGDF